MLHLSRRAALAQGGALAALLALAPAALAQDVGRARALVDELVAQVNAVIASGLPEAAMIDRFAAIFLAYADVPTIARYSLGADARALSADQMARYTQAFAAYVARKYGSRFREFIGGQVVVEDARPVPNGIEVRTTAYLRGQAPFRVDFWVSDRSGQLKFFNMVVEGVNMLLAERTEIQAMLDQRRGDVERLIADLARG
ncbi:phospholipid-binding protein MlaC [Rubellimicrobium sp. CFH 75288]|uniref:MlaC/ttg2D family ABC transporter substrate-binding protein n=1 Tax=Rubellimicrobium sp. CFH 75288 TaxID=2697034 RepID=UPI001412D455|nr:ABC transporter substrate-binding protein [Rubellimicrobium sp. CFH 75288]NAZ37674.1 ABC transporter substrate-binding protein [Rubellimicrobium sp. CFH 75288]